jgi:hypothetical protein
LNYISSFYIVHSFVAKAYHSWHAYNSWFLPLSLVCVVLFIYICGDTAIIHISLLTNFFNFFFHWNMLELLLS